MSGNCVLVEKCGGYDPRTGTANPSRRPLCRDCEYESEREIRLLPYDYVDLSQLIVRRGGTTETKIARPKPSSIPPIDVEIEALRAGIAWQLNVWEPHVRWSAGLPLRPSGPVRQGWRVQAATDVIAPRTQLLAALPDTWCYADGAEADPLFCTGAEAILRLRALHRRARAVAGLTRRIFTLPGDCPNCGGLALRRQDGADRVYCAVCRGQWPYEQYTRWVNVVVNDRQ